MSYRPANARLRGHGRRSPQKSYADDSPQNPGNSIPALITREAARDTQSGNLGRSRVRLTSAITFQAKCCAAFDAQELCAEPTSLLHLLLYPMLVGFGRRRGLRSVMMPMPIAVKACSDDICLGVIPAVLESNQMLARALELPGLSKREAMRSGKCLDVVVPHWGRAVVTPVPLARKREGTRTKEGLGHSGSSELREPARPNGASRDASRETRTDDYERP